MTQFLAERPKVSDLRGSVPPLAGGAILEDPSGRRRRRLRVLGRLAAIALTLWLVALVLGAVGLSPVPGIPFSTALRPATPPPAVKRLPEPSQPTAADLQPALPQGAAAARLAERPSEIPTLTRQRAAVKRGNTPTNRSAPSQRSVTVHTMSPSAQGPAAPTAPGVTNTHPNNGRHTGAQTGTSTAPTTTGTSTSPGRSDTSPGRTGTAPGQTRTSTR